jgi:hypothetical protein
MNTAEIRRMIEKLLAEIEEEDIGISLFTTQYQDEDEMAFFAEPDRANVRKILERLTADSRHHKEILKEVIAHLEEKCDENGVS